MNATNQSRFDAQHAALALRFFVLRDEWVVDHETGCETDATVTKCVSIYELEASDLDDMMPDTRARTLGAIWAMGWAVLPVRGGRLEIVDVRSEGRGYGGAALLATVMRARRVAAATSIAIEKGRAA